ncbi:unnamed protein product [Amoebophrya sp. A25]|nr:unnamed protein product [Amoebophrya sp. A25]|eukprot:GSA25T00014620001.1
MAAMQEPRPQDVSVSPWILHLPDAQDSTSQDPSTWSARCLCCVKPGGYAEPDPLKKYKHWSASHANAQRNRCKKQHLPGSVDEMNKILAERRRLQDRYGVHPKDTKLHTIFFLRTRLEPGPIQRAYIATSRLISQLWSRCRKNIEASDGPYDYADGFDISEEEKDKERDRYDRILDMLDSVKVHTTRGEDPATQDDNEDSGHRAHGSTRRRSRSRQRQTRSRERERDRRRRRSNSRERGRQTEEDLDRDIYVQDEDGWRVEEDPDVASLLPEADYFQNLEEAQLGDQLGPAHSNNQFEPRNGGGHRNRFGEGRHRAETLSEDASISDAAALKDDGETEDDRFFPHEQQPERRPATRRRATSPPRYRGQGMYAPTLRGRNPFRS